MKPRRFASSLLAGGVAFWGLGVVYWRREGGNEAVPATAASGGDGSRGSASRYDASGSMSVDAWPQWIRQLLVAQVNADEAEAQALEAAEQADQVDEAVVAEVGASERPPSQQGIWFGLGRPPWARHRHSARELGPPRILGGSNSSKKNLRRFKGMSVNGDDWDTEERRLYIQDRINIDEEVLREVTVPPDTVRPELAEVQVAFLFIVMDGLDFEAVWDRFFKDAPRGLYSIYVHRALPEAERQLTALPLQRWRAMEVPWVPNGWCALMGVEVALLSAALRDPQNQQFVFLSHSTVPLKSFGYVYHQLGVVTPKTSKFCLAEPAQHRTAIAETVAQELKRQCVFRDFYRTLNPRTLKHHQWVVLAREHAVAVVRHGHNALHIWRRSWERAAPDIANMGEGCSDEAVPVAALLHSIEVEGRSTGNTWADLTRMGVEQQCLTYVHWRNCFGNTDLDLREPVTKELMTVMEHGDLRMLTDRDFNFFQSTLKRELNGYPSIFSNMTAAYLSTLTGYGFMFARKLVPDLRVETGTGLLALEDALPPLWAAVDEERAARMVWTRLESAGEPRQM